MKPSDRINDLAKVAAIRMGGEGSAAGIDMVSCFLGAIAKHLDEQHELAERREHLRNAIALACPGVPASVVNASLAKAGLVSQFYEEDDCCLARSQIVEEAQRAGLL